MNAFMPGMGAYMGGNYDQPTGTPGQAGVGASVAVNANTGQATAGTLLAIAVLLVGFYVYTRKIQGSR